jgi:hypothetical protein
MLVEFGFGFGSVFESESSAYDAADAVASFDGPGTGGSSALMGEAVMSAVRRAMYVSSAAAGRLAYRGRVNTINFAMRCIRASTGDTAAISAEIDDASASRAAIGKRTENSVRDGRGRRLGRRGIVMCTRRSKRDWVCAGDFGAWWSVGGCRGLYGGEGRTYLLLLLLADGRGMSLDLGEGERSYYCSALQHHQHQSKPIASGELTLTTTNHLTRPPLKDPLIPPNKDQTSQSPNTPHILPPHILHSSPHGPRLPHPTPPCLHTDRTKHPAPIIFALESACFGLIEDSGVRRGG